MVCWFSGVPKTKILLFFSMINDQTKYHAIQSELFTLGFSIKLTKDVRNKLLP
jgi:hypothetical protein